MPYFCTWEAKGVYLRFSGVVTLAEVTESDDAMYEDPRFADIDYFIWDASKVTSLSLSDTQVDITAVRDMRVSLKKDRLKCAFIATEQRLIKQLEQYLEKTKALKICWQMALFQDIDRARQWLSE
ncbi:hypothetical protein SG34_019905 [Thalassomonas viridans]|uniref:Uncharacterized protein n=1 Tax=Thalassomonas viridans TaxID=137584 RepID=A0AAF0C7R8_9GAMM|nr:hypothetical protein [Thalassomonas viridans]WDE03631.1 hypothetical protein SG34_019905 [Thalassomonas viridans]